MQQTTSEIGRAGEWHAVNWLKSNGYAIDRWDTQSPGSTDIEAHGAERVLVQVKSAIYPNEPAYLSSDEVRNIKSRATRIGANPYFAKVSLNQDLSLRKKIEWVRLN